VLLTDKILLQCQQDTTNKNYIIEFAVSAISNKIPVEVSSCHINQKSRE